MKILLITPNDCDVGFEYIYSSRENLGVEYLLSSLRSEGFECISINENIKNSFNKECIDYDAFDIIGFSLPFWEYREKYVKKINDVSGKTNAVIIAGGHAATIGAKYFIAKCKKLVGIVMGEGEEILIEIVKKVENNQDPSKVLGLMSRDAYIPRYNLKPLDDLPFPVRDELLLSINSNSIVKEALVESTRGCTYNCTFCSIPSYYKYSHGKKWRERSVNNICNELTNLISDFPQINLISFTDDNFLGFKSDYHDRAKKIAQHLHELKNEIAFEIVCRADAIQYDSFKTLSSFGLAGVYLGIESGVQRVLDSFKKNTTVEKNINALNILKELNIGCDVGFITFTPGMTLSEIKMNYEFLKMIIEEYQVFVHPAAIFRCLREYPRDLGVAAITGEDPIIYTKLDAKVQMLYEVLDVIWKKKYESEFIRCEGLAVSSSNNSKLLNKQKNITNQMLKIAFILQNELQKYTGVTKHDLLKEYAGDALINQDKICTTNS